MKRRICETLLDVLIIVVAGLALATLGYFMV